MAGDEITIFRMNASNENVQGRLYCSIALEYPKFPPSYEFAGGDVPAETSGLAQSLGFGQIHFAVQQPGLDLPLIFQRRQQLIAGTLGDVAAVLCDALSQFTKSATAKNRVRRGSCLGSIASELTGETR